MSKVPKITSLQYHLQYLKKDASYEVDFLPADKHQAFLKVHIGPSLLDSLFNKAKILKIVMPDGVIIHYSLFSRKNNTCS